MYNEAEASTVTEIPLLEQLLRRLKAVEEAIDGNPKYLAELKKDYKALKEAVQEAQTLEEVKSHERQQALLHEVLGQYYSPELVSMVRLFSNTPEYKIWKEFIQARIKALAAALD